MEKSRSDELVPVSGAALLKVREGWRLSQADFATVLHVRREWVSRKEARRDATMRQKTLRHLAVAMRRTPEEALEILRALDFAATAGKSAKDVEIPSLDRDAFLSEFDANVEPYSLRSVPEIPTFNLPLAAGHWTDVADSLGDNDPCRIDHGVFRVRLRGDSMQPRYKEGDTVEFRCLRADRDGVIVGRNYYVQRSDGSATFKQVEAVDDEIITLRALNRRKYPNPMLVERAMIVRMAIAVGKFDPE